MILCALEWPRLLSPPQLLQPLPPVLRVGAVGAHPDLPEWAQAEGADGGDDIWMVLRIRRSPHSGDADSRVEPSTEPLYFEGTANGVEDAGAPMSGMHEHVILEQLIASQGESEPGVSQPRFAHGRPTEGHRRVVKHADEGLVTGAQASPQRRRSLAAEWRNTCTPAGGSPAALKYRCKLP